MGKILSQEEVRALLQQPGRSSSEDATTGEELSVSEYDFRDRENLPRSELQYLQAFHERYAQSVEASLNAYMRSTIDVRLDSLQQMSSRRFLQSLADPTGIFVASATGEDSVIVIVDSGLGFVLVDRLLGGPGEKTELNRAITSIEQGVLEGVVLVILKALEAAWSPVFQVGFDVTGRETRPALLSIDVPVDGFIVLNLKTILRVAEPVEGTIRLAVPVSLAQRLVSSIPGELVEVEEHQPTEEEVITMESLLLPIPIRLTVDLPARHVTAGDLLKLESGSILDLGRAVQELAPLRIGKTVAFEGTLVLSEQRRAVEIKVATLGEA